MDSDKIVYFLLVILFSQNISAGDVSFDRLSIDDGLSQNSVHTIIQDQHGFMWFGTKDGLNRYDGYSFKNYYHNPFDTSSLSGNHITTLFEDSRGYIWIGTIKDGVNCFSPSEEIFHRITLDPQAGNKGSSNQIKSIEEDHQGNIWVGTGGKGLFQLSFNNKDQETRNSNHHHNTISTIEGLEERTIFSLHFDSENMLWIGSDNALYQYDPVNQRLVHHMIKSHDPLNSENPFSSDIFSIYESRDGFLWLGMKPALAKFDRYSGQFSFHEHRYSRNSYGWEKITRIAEDDSGMLWLASPGGLMRFDPTRYEYDYFPPDANNQKSISYNVISGLCLDKTGNLWIGTAGMGINIYKPLANQFSLLNRKKDIASRITGFSIQSVLEDNTGNIWISAGVLYRLDKKTGELISFETTSDSPDDFGNTPVLSMLQARDYAIWAATERGLYRYNYPIGDLIHYKYNSQNPDGLKQEEISSVFQDSKGSIWVATNMYLSKLLDVEKGIFQHYRYAESSLDNIQLRSVIYEDREDKLWLGTNSGLYRFDPLTGSFSVYRNDPANSLSLNNNSVKSICPDPSDPGKYLWIGTDGGGLNLFNMKDETFRQFTIDNGLPNNVIYAILPDKEGKLWLSTNRGISRFDPVSGSFKNYDKKDGLQSNEFNTGAFFLGKDGKMFFGGIKGLNYFYPEDIRNNPYKPNIVITNVKILDRESSDGKEMEIHNIYSRKDKLIFSHGDRNIVIEYAGLDYSAPEKNQYAYKLENYDKQWIYAGSGRNVTYTHLPQGEYIFRVKASNNHGLWNDTGTSLGFVITPPWWKKWWAYSLYLLIFASGLYLIRRVELSRIKLKNQLSVEKVETDTLRKLDQLKTNFFANISHEFRTPLTLILGHLESVASSPVHQKDKNRIKIAKKNASRLLGLINQLLDLSKIEAGGMELNTSLTNIVSFLKNVLYSFESLAHTKNISLHFESNSENIPVVFDVDKMEKVFYNLISNSFKFTNDGGEIKVSVKSRKDRVVEIHIEDNGIGIPSDRLSKIFDRFYQGDNSIRKEFEGTGIGLALAKELIEIHNGKISVRSEESKGTLFIIEIPMGILSLEHINPESGISGKTENTIIFEHEPESKYSGDKVSVITKQNDINKEIILIVEDNTDLRDYIREKLEEKYHVIEAKDGQEGVNLAEEFLPDLIITDVMMPRKDGYQLCTEIRANEKTAHIPLIMLTAKACMEDKLEGLETGIDDYLTKPFNEKELKLRIINLISQRKELRKRFSKSTVIKPSEVTAVSVDKAFLEKTLKIIEEHFEDEHFSVNMLAEKVNMSISQLNRKLNSLISQPAGHLIRSLKLQRAADLLSQNSGSISEICYKLGFSDQAYFSRAFKKQFGTSPRGYRERGVGSRE